MWALRVADDRARCYGPAIPIVPRLNDRCSSEPDRSREKDGWIDGALAARRKVESEKRVKKDKIRAERKERKKERKKRERDDRATRAVNYTVFVSDWAFNDLSKLSSFNWFPRLCTACRYPVQSRRV